MHDRRLLLAAALGTLAFAALPACAVTKRKPHADDGSFNYGRRDDVMRFADELAAARGLDPAWVQEQLAQARYQPQVARLIMPPPPGTSKNWMAYRARFVEPKRLRAGVAFWDANEAWLALAHERFGVPPFVVIGIIGVETFFGQQMGHFRVLDALATLAFDFPSGRSDRSAFFRDELGEFLALAQREGVDPPSLLGSYAGAMGMPQFMPSSRSKYALDFDGDGRIDLHGSSADVIGSIAHYLAEFGWQRDQPTQFEVAAPVAVVDRATLLVPDVLPTFSAAQFAEHGARLDDAGQAYDGPLALIELQNGDDAAASYVAGTNNFYVITRYNWSAYYAMAVIELGRAVEGARRGNA